jgi:hypothetical protein
VLFTNNHYYGLRILGFRVRLRAGWRVIATSLPTLYDSDQPPPVSIIPTFEGAQGACGLFTALAGSVACIIETLYWSYWVIVKYRLAPLESGLRNPP